jgi:hypothetical protein
MSIVVWLIMAAIIGMGVVLAVKGSLWLLVISVVAFFGMMAKYGCATH